MHLSERRRCEFRTGSRSSASAQSQVFSVDSLAYGMAGACFNLALRGNCSAQLQCALGQLLALLKAIHIKTLNYRRILGEIFALIQTNSHTSSIHSKQELILIKELRTRAAAALKMHWLSVFWLYANNNNDAHFGIVHSAQKAKPNYEYLGFVRIKNNNEKRFLRWRRTVNYNTSYDFLSVCCFAILSIFVCLLYLSNKTEIYAVISWARAIRMNKSEILCVSHGDIAVDAN